MPQSLSAVYLHVVYSTKDRHPHLTDGGFRREVHAYLAELTNRRDCPALEIGGVEDHIHMLIRLGKQITTSDWIREIKRLSSSFVRERIPEFSWQAGYGMFSVGARDLKTVAAYISNQEEHHHKVVFKDEFRKLMIENGVEFDERHVWD